VRGRIAKPSGAGPHPVVVLVGPDGAAQGPFVEAALSALLPRSAVVVFDLPLCGSRRSDKLTALALDPRQKLGRRLRADLEAQLDADLAAVLALVAAEPDLDATRVTFAGVGLGAKLAGPAATRAKGFARVALAPGGRSPAAWLKALAKG
jgi:dienelactone hydrolase